MKFSLCFLEVQNEWEGLILNICMFSPMMGSLPQQVLYFQIVTFCGQESTHFSTTGLLTPSVLNQVASEENLASHRYICFSMQLI